MSVEAVAPNILRFTGLLRAQQWHTFVTIGERDSDRMSPASLEASFVQVKAGPDGKFNLALLTPDLRRRLLVGYPTEKIAASEQWKN
jgi:hypothetical protein